MIPPIVCPLMALILLLWVFEAGFTLGWEARSLHQHGLRLDLMKMAKRRMIGAWETLKPQE